MDTANRASAAIMFVARTLASVEVADAHNEVAILAEEMATVAAAAAS